MNKQDESNKCYSIEEVSEKLKIKPNSVYSHVRGGVIEVAKRSKRKNYYYREEIDALESFLTSSIHYNEISYKTGKNLGTIKKYILKLNIKILNNPINKQEKRIMLQDYYKLISYFKENDIDVLSNEKFTPENNGLLEYFDYSYIKEIFEKIRYYDHNVGYFVIVNATKRICKELNVAFILSKDPNNIFISNKYKDVFTEHMMFLGEILTSQDYFSFQYIRDTIGLKIKLRTLRKRVKSFWCKNTYWFKKKDIQNLTNKGENILKLTEVTKLLNARNNYIVLRIIKKCGVEFLKQGNEIYINKLDFDNINEQFEFNKKLEVTKDRYDKYKLFVEKLNLSNEVISDTLLLFNKYIFKRFKENSNNMFVNTFVSMYEFFNKMLKKELYSYDEKSIENLFKMISWSSKYSQNFKTEMVNFYNYCLKERSIVERKEYSLPMHNLTEKKMGNNKPYTKEQFLNLWGLVFLNVDNAEYLNRAINSRTLAMAWLYLALHYVTLWRADAIRNIPAPNLKIIGFNNGESFIKWLKNNIGIFSEDMGQKICNNVKLKINSFDLTATKNDEPLVFEVGRTMVRQVGLLLALCEAHRQISLQKSSVNINSEVLITTTIKTIRNYYSKLFGNEFLKVMKGETFSNRRASKSYVNYIIENSEEGKKGISEFIITLMRSHKMNKYMYAQSNQYYEDRTVDETLEDIELTLFNIGTFGFAKYKLLSILKQGFESLGSAKQIKMIEGLSITPYEAEVLIKTIGEQREIINKLIFKMSVNSGLIKETLRIIANGQATAKHHHTQCLLRAMVKAWFNDETTLNSLEDIIKGKLEDFKCIHIESDTCFGCPLLIGEMYFLIELNEVIKNALTNLEKSKDNFEKYMYSNMIFKGYLPILDEACEEFGIEKVKCFIDTSSFSARLKLLDEKGEIILNLKGDLDVDNSKAVRE